MNLPCKIVLFIYLFIMPFALLAQEDLRNDSRFFEDKLSEYNEWLEAKGFSSVLWADSLKVYKSNVNVYLGYAQEKQEDFALNVAWDKLKREYEKKSSMQFEEVLFNHLFFTLGIAPDSLDLYVLGHKPHLFTVTVFGSDIGVYVDDKIATPRDPENIPIPVIDLKNKYISQKDKVKAPDLKTITNEVRMFLKNYYKNKGAWWYFAEIEVVKDFQHELIIEITDLKGEILKNERQYFEYIRISVKAEKQGKNVILVYDLMAKYGSGIFLAPRSVSDYKNMDIKYPNSLEKYREKLKSLIHKYLTK